MKRVHISCIPFLMGFGLVLIILSVVFVMFINQASKGVVTKDSWLPNAYWAKCAFAERVKIPKIVLLGGSATLFSTDSKVIEKMCGRPVVNLALHAGMPFRFYSDYVRRYISTNDVVVVVLEPHHHYGDNVDKIYSDLSLNFLWGFAPEFQRTLSPKMLFNLYSGYGCKYLDMLLSQKRSARLHREDALSAWEEARSTKPKRGYDLHYMNEHGDLHMPMGQAKELSGAKGRYYAGILSAEFVETYARLKAMVEKRRARLMLTCPNLFHYPNASDSLDRLVARLSSAGIHMAGHLETFHFPARYYYDTVYHMSGPGATLYSRELAKTICRFLGKEYVLGDEQMISFLEHVEAIKASGAIRWYAHGIRITNDCFSVELRRPSCLNGKKWACEFLLDSQGSNNKMVESIFLNGQAIRFEEVACRCKNIVRFILPSGIFCAMLDFKIRPQTHVGLERVFIDDASLFTEFTFLRRDYKIRAKGGVSFYPGPYGVWTDGDAAILQFALCGECINDNRYNMEFVVAPICADQEVQCFCAGRNFGIWKFNGKGEQIMSLSIPADLVEKNVATLEFRMKKTVCPRELGRGTDKRHLGIRFLSARIVDR